MKYPLIIGNWKLNGDIKSISIFTKKLCHKMKNIIGCKIVMALPTIYLFLANSFLKQSNILLAAQNVDTNLSGPFTGEVSANMLKDVGTKYVIIGHSERRNLHKEDIYLVAKKFEILKKTNLIPVLCIGENKTNNNQYQIEKICSEQIDIIVNNLGIKAFINSVIAYEPVWAIGTGKTANPQQVQKIHKFIRNYIANLDKQVAKQLIIQYGGSVTPNNAASFFEQPDINGVLVGGSSLIIKDFIEIILIAAKKNNLN